MIVHLLPKRQKTNGYSATIERAKKYPGLKVISRLLYICAIVPLSLVCQIEISVSENSVTCYHRRLRVWQ